MSAELFFDRLRDMNRWEGLVYNDLLYLPRRRIIFCSCSKNASSKIKTELYRLEHGTPLPKEVNPHQRAKLKFLGPSDMGFDGFYQAIFDPDVLKFTVLREPWSRLVSCYKSRVSSFKLEEYDSNWAIRSEWLPNRQKMLRYLLNVRASEIRAVSTAITFDQFLEYVVNQPFYDMDRHWYPQSRSTFIDEIPYQIVGTLDDLDQILSEVAERTGAEGYEYSEERVNESRGGEEELAVSDELKARFRVKFACDFEIYSASQKGWHRA